jgi:putative nucleotidyltransferase with HDIG domain
MQILSLVLQPNLLFSESDTEANYTENLANLSLTKGAVDQGQIIVRRGDIVTPDTANILNSLAEARSLTATSLERWMRYLGETIIISIAIMMFFIYIYLYRKPIFERPVMFFLVFLVLTIVILPSSIIYPFESVNSLIIPIAISPIILTIIFDSRVGLMATVSLAIITGVIHDYNFEYMVATIAACSLGVFSVRDIKKRSQFFFITPGIVFITYVMVSAGFSLARFTGWDTFIENLFFIGVNSVFILFTYPLILLFEKLFKITTDFTLLELADTNLPLMKDLMNKAPGTFHHSLQVANLAESAASNIGANALLCRVGAMYHDIGKMIKPSYFIENQNKNNDHDKLKPRMSALVIKAHVSEGVKIARDHNLPEVLVDFIRTHHGTSLIRYFHSKAMESSDNVLDDDFRYDGPIPFTKEQGILMLADGVEASCRSMKDTTYSKLEAQINRIVDGNINDEQLSNCPLTFKQIQIIKESFLSILKGVYHSRIEYPNEDEEQVAGASDKKAPKNNPTNSPQ